MRVHLRTLSHTQNPNSPIGTSIMNRGSIDLKTISYRDVASSSSFSFSKPSLYVTIYLLDDGDGDGRVRPLRHRHKTPLLPHCSDPEWEHPVRIYIHGPDPVLPLPPLFLRFELTARTHLLPNRVIGVTSVPVADLCSAAGDLRRNIYQVTSPDSKPNGVLSFSYIMNSPSPVSFAAAKAPPPPPKAKLYPLLVDLIPDPPPPPPKAKLYPSLVDLIPDPPPPPPLPTTEAPRVCYPAIDPAQASEQLYPAPPMDTVVAYPAPAQVSGWCYPALPQCGFCGYFAPPGSCGCPAPR